MNSEKSKTCNPHVLILKITNTLDLRMSENVIALSNLSIYYTLRNMKSSYITINIKYLHQHGMINLNYQMDGILYQVFRIILSIFLKNMEKIFISH